MSQDIEIDPDSRTIKYYDNRTEQSIREHVDSGGRVLSCEQVRVLLYEIDRLRMLVPPETERGPGFVGQGRWSVYAEKVVAERDELRDELSSLCEEIRCLKEENDELRDELEQLGVMISAKKELANIHYGHDEFLGIDGYGPFSLKRIDKDEWEVRMLQERVVLYNKKGRRVRAHIVDGNPEGDW